MELRHLRYFTAVVEAKGYREAARRRNVAQPALSQSVTELEEELGVKLFVREKRRVSLTPEGEVFYVEAMRTLEQANNAVEAARRAGRGEVGTLRIGFLGSATCLFLPGLVRLYRKKYPGVKLILEELTPQQQEEKFLRDELDIGFTRPLSKDQLEVFNSRHLYKEPLLIAMPDCCAASGKSVALNTLEGRPLVLFHRYGAPALFDMITGLCNEAGFTPRVEHEPNMMQTVLALVAAEAGAAIIPACVRNLRADGVSFFRLNPDRARVDLVAVWRKASQSVVLRSFLDLLEQDAKHISTKVRAHLP